LNNNRGGNNRRRGRGNNSRPQGASGGQQVNRIDSRARGNAPQMLEKFRKLANDAHLNGDRVNAEYYLQFADHYFRVIADTRLRQEEQRLRRDDRWQENGETDREEADEAGDFNVESDFPTFDQPPVYTRREREDRPERPERGNERAPEERAERTQNGAADGLQREDRPAREEPQGRNFEQNRGDQNRSEQSRAERYRPDPNPADGEGGEAALAEETGEDTGAGRNLYEPEENPFLREARGGRGLRPRREDRRPRREERAEPAAPAADQGEDREARAVAAGIDPDTLPPSFTAPRAEAVTIAPVDSAPIETADEPPAPRRRARRKPTADDAGEPVESVR
jgi:hypothetical protein